MYKVPFNVGGEIIIRPEHKLEYSELLMLNENRGIMINIIPYLVDGNKNIIFDMPNAVAEVSFLKRGATISWDHEILGKLHYKVKCDSKLKYDRLKELLPSTRINTYVPPITENIVEESIIEEPIIEEEMEIKIEKEMPDEIPEDREVKEMPKIPKKEKKRRFRWPFSKGKNKRKKYNRGTFNGSDITVTDDDLMHKLGRFDPDQFEAVCANLFAAMGYTIEKGFDCSKNIMLGPTTGDKGVDVIAAKDKERIIIQCKKWVDKVGDPDVTKTVGAVLTFDGTSALVIGTGGFTRAAYETQEKSSMDIELWDWNILRGKLKKHLV